MFKKVTNKKTGKDMWYKDGRLVSVKDVPEEEKNPQPKISPDLPLPQGITGGMTDDPAYGTVRPPTVEQIEKADELGIEDPNLHTKEDLAKKIEEKKPVYKAPENCLFCGQPSEHSKDVRPDPETVVRVHLCGNCYYDKSTGKIIEKLRKGE